MYIYIYICIYIYIYICYEALRFNDVDKQVSIFSGTLMNIMQNFIPNETIICDDRDPPWKAN